MLKVPTAKELQARIAAAEGEKASAAAKAHAAAEAEKKAFLDRISKPSGLTDDQVIEKASSIISRAVESGLTSVQVFRFPNHLCTDNGRAINQGEAGWEKTLTGIPKEIYDFWTPKKKKKKNLIHYHIIDYPGGMPGDVGVTLSWG